MATNFVDPTIMTRAMLSKLMLWSKTWFSKTAWSRGKKRVMSGGFAGCHWVASSWEFISAITSGAEMENEHLLAKASIDCRLKAYFGDFKSTDGCGWCFFGSHLGQRTESSLNSSSSEIKYCPQSMCINPSQTGQWCLSRCSAVWKSTPRQHWMEGKDDMVSRLACAPNTDKNEKKWCFLHHRLHCVTTAWWTKPEYGSHKYTKLDWPERLSGSTVITGVKNLMVIIDHL
jgi:hypothetical protein